METNVNDSAGGPRIYVASLADYNSGRLHGKWIDATQTAEEIREQIQQMLAASIEPVAEDWAIHDYEGFGKLKLGELEDIPYVAEVALLIQEHGTLFAAVTAYACDINEARKYMEEGYCGAFNSVEEYAEQLAEDLYGHEITLLPDLLRHHIDYDGVARDLELSGDIFTIEHDGKIHVFNSYLG
jgi:antirestriction protein